MKGLLQSGMYKDKFYWMKKGAAILVIITMVATCVQAALISDDVEVVEAAEEGEGLISLSAIEELKEAVKSSADQTYTILEVVPAEGTSSMGYWVPGEEPLTYYDSDSEESISFIDKYSLNTVVGTTERTTAATSVTDDLTELGLLSSVSAGSENTESTTALTSAAYAEYIIGIDTDIPDEAVLIELVDATTDETRTEDKKLSGADGVFEYKANSTGDFIIESSEVALQENGSYTQNIEMFLTGDEATKAIAAGAPEFYYQITTDSFTAIVFDDLDTSINSSDYAGRAIYTAKTDGSTISYEYLGSLGVDDFTLEIVDDETYYWMEDDTIDYTKIKTSITTADTDYYLGIGDFVQVEENTGYFSANIAYVYVGAGNGSYSYNTSLTSTVNPIVRYDSLYVNVGFTNNNWFRQYVLDDDTTSFADEFNIEVVEVLAEALTIDDINAADLVVFSAGFSLSLDKSSDNYSSLYISDNDISEEVSNALIEMIAGEAYKEMETPILVDGNLQEYINTTEKIIETTTTIKTTTETSTMTNDRPSKYDTSTELVTSDPTIVTDTTTEYYSSNTQSTSTLTYLATFINKCAEELSADITTNTSTSSNSPDESDESTTTGNTTITITTTTTVETTTTTTTYSYTNLNNYGSAAGGLYYTAQGASLVTRDIIDKIVEGTDYYSEVSATISYENFLRETTGASEVLTGTAAEINIGTSIRHILMVGDQVSATQKTSISVLEVQPDNSSDDTDENNTEVLDANQVATWFPEVDEDQITIDRMPVYEFIGKIDDITEKYDVIYIGADFGTLNTMSSNGETIVNYNDNDMDGLFYTNIGDTYTVDSDFRLSGLLNSDYESPEEGISFEYKISNVTYYALYEKMNTTYRFSGNDITPTKLEELITFVDTGLPVIISEELITTDSSNSNSVDITRVDQASYMYEFLEYAIDKSNVFISSEMTDTDVQDTANQYLNLTKPEIVFSVKPAEYVYVDEESFEKSLVDDNTLIYTFKITNDTDPTPEDTSYSVSLYIDQDADGNHEDSELISELTITDEYGYEVAYDELKVNVSYTVTKVLPDSYVGAIPWKLEVSIVDREEFHTSETGYTYIMPETAETIKILQIRDAGGGLITANDEYKECIEEIDSIYILEIDNIYISALNAKSSEAEIYAYLNDYDMLILGFADGYGINTDPYGGLSYETAMAVDSYIDSGKAVLFTHDTTFTANLPTESYPVFSVESTTEEVWVKVDYDPIYALSPSGTTNMDDWIINTTTIASYFSAYDTYDDLVRDINSYGQGDGTYTIDGVTVWEYETSQIGTNNSYWSESYGGVAYQQFLYPQPDSNWKYNSELNQWGYYTTITTEEGTASYSKMFTEGWYTGYYFNTVLRDSIGLDRYGVTNEEYESVYAYLHSDEYEDSYVANGYISEDTGDIIDEDTVDEILDSGYSIAYAPTTTEYTDDYVYTTETQGYTKNAIFLWSTFSSSQLQPSSVITSYEWDGTGSGDSYTRTTSISQVNQGQITTFPYNVNTSEFGSTVSSSTISVAETHFQYYQLNMNSDEVVVWYCLTDNIYDAYPNDVVNTYYIYNIGNVTYSGAGHTSLTSTSGVTEAEAQLFINTMIAAYRAGRVSPEIAFVDSDGAAISSMYFTMDEVLSSTDAVDTLLVSEDVASSEAEITFEISDTNLENPKSRYITLSYYDSDNEIDTIITSDITIYDSDGELVKNGSLMSNTTYTLVIPDAVLSELSKTAVSSLELKITVYIEFEDEKTFDGTALVDLYKLGLQNLN